MDRERLARILSAVLVPLGIVGLILGVLSGDYSVAVLSTVTAIVGAIFFLAVGRYWTTEFDLTKTPSFVLSLVTSGTVLLLFGILTYLVSDFETVIRAVRAGIPSQRRPTYVGILMGLFLGGGIPYLAQRRDFFERLNQSSPARMIGLSITSGTYLLLLLYQPVASVIYAVVYLVSRIGVLVGMYALPRN